MGEQYNLMIKIDYFFKLKTKNNMEKEKKERKREQYWSQTNISWFSEDIFRRQNSNRYSWNGSVEEEEESQETPPDDLEDVDEEEEEEEIDSDDEDAVARRKAKQEEKARQASKLKWITGKPNHF